MKRACDVCGEEYEAKRRTSRFCSERCKKRSQRAPVSAQVVALPDSLASSLVDVTRRQLDEAGRLDTYLGQQAIELASRIVRTGTDTGSSTAALSKELRAVMAEALADAERAADPLDELKAWRERKRANAG